MKTAFITGSGRSGRTGRYLADDLAAHGALPVLHCLEGASDARRAVAELTGLGLASFWVQGDLCVPAEVARVRDEVLRRAGNLDWLVHAVGSYRGRVRATNFDSAVLVCEAFLPHLSQGGRILLFGAAGLGTGSEANPSDGEYLRAKKDLLRYMRELALRVVRRGITVNMISPGEMEYSVVERRDLPLGRRIRPDELCRACRFLLDDGSAAITGQNLEVAGGLDLLPS